VEELADCIAFNRYTESQLNNFVKERTELSLVFLCPYAEAAREAFNNDLIVDCQHENAIWHLKEIFEQRQHLNSNRRIESIQIVNKKDNAFDFLFRFSVLVVLLKVHCDGIG